MPDNHTSEDNIFTAAEAVSRDVGVEPDFLLRMREEDDWSFVIKLHALLEAATAHLLTHHFADRRIEPHFHALRLTGRAGQLELAKRLELIGDHEARFAQRLSELRNSLVHEISNIGFRFETYVTQPSEPKATEFVRDFGDAWIEELEINGARVSRRDMTLANPRVTVWLGAIGFLAAVHLGKAKSELDWRSKRLEVVEEFLGPWKRRGEAGSEFS